MEIKEFIQNFADQFDDTDASVFTPETNDVKIKGDDVRNSQTINDLYEIVKSRL